MNTTEIKEKMELAWQLLNEVVTETKKLNDTENNKKIASLMAVFGEENFLETIDTMRAWVNGLD